MHAVVQMRLLVGVSRCSCSMLAMLDAWCDIVQLLLRLSAHPLAGADWSEGALTTEQMFPVAQARSWTARARVVAAMNGSFLQRVSD